jgi:hypothetical protein
MRLLGEILRRLSEGSSNALLNVEYIFVALRVLGIGGRLSTVCTGSKALGIPSRSKPIIRASMERLWKVRSTRLDR